TNSFARSGTVTSRRASARCAKLPSKKGPSQRTLIIAAPASAYAPARAPGERTHESAPALGLFRFTSAIRRSGAPGGRVSAARATARRSSRRALGRSLRVSRRGSSRGRSRRALLGGGAPHVEHTRGLAIVERGAGAVRGGARFLFEACGDERGRGVQDHGLA